jgi:hypothetical protein
VAADNHQRTERHAMIETQERVEGNAPPAPPAGPLLTLVTWVARTLGAARGGGVRAHRDYIDLQLSVMRRK